jgi:hypothetical protein
MLLHRHLAGRCGLRATDAVRGGPAAGAGRRERVLDCRAGACMFVYVCVCVCLFVCTCVSKRTCNASVLSGRPRRPSWQIQRPTRGWERSALDAVPCDVYLCGPASVSARGVPAGGGESYGDTGGGYLWHGLEPALQIICFFCCTRWSACALCALAFGFVALSRPSV